MISINTLFYKRALYALTVSLIFGALGIVTAPAIADAAPSQSAGRILRAVSTNAERSGEAFVVVELDSMGDEVAMGFSLNFDPSKLNTPVVTLGSGVPSGTTITRNLNHVASGRIGVLLDSMNAFAASGPAREVVVIKFNVSNDAPEGPTLITFGSTPISRSTSNGLGGLVATGYQDGSVTIGTVVAPTITVSGVVRTPSGTGLRNASVTLTDSNNNRRVVPTASLGYYSFPDVEPGQYTISVGSRQYRFDTRVVQVNGSVNVDFTGLE